MARKKCSRGHVYDYEIYRDNCPFCPPSAGSTKVNEDGGGTEINLGETGRTSITNEADPTEFFTGSNSPGGATLIRPAGGATNMPNGRKIAGLLFSYSTNPLGEVFNLYEGKNYIGRSVRDCDICLSADTRISNKHLSILFRTIDGKFKFKDEQSSNGTFINNELTDEGELKNLDILRIGDSTLVFIAIPKFD